MFKDHVEVPGLDKEKSKLDDLINQMRYFKDFIKKLNRMDVTSNQSQHQIKNGEMLHCKQNISDKSDVLMSQGRFLYVIINTITKYRINKDKMKE